MKNLIKSVKNFIISLNLCTFSLENKIRYIDGKRTINPRLYLRSELGSV